MVRAAAAGMLLIAAPAAADIARVTPVPETAHSKIYGRSTVAGSPQSIDLRAAGYVEREYFVAGKANSYALDPAGRRRVLDRDVPYVTRIIVRLPRNPKRFSGVVHFEPMHPAQGLQSNWFATASYIMASGDAYVAASLGDDPTQRAASAKAPAPTAQSLVSKWFDPQRYTALQWPAEDGIRFEVMADMGRLLRSARPDNPLHELPVRRLFVEGWSFTGSVQRTFINEGFHDAARLPGGQPVFDGYLIGISSRWNGSGYLPLNTKEQVAAPDSPRRNLMPIDVPVIELMTEFEAATGPGPQLADSDAKVGSHRLYQLPGVVHGESLNDVRADRTTRLPAAQLAAKNYPFGPAPISCSLPASDLPHGAFARAAIANLKRWSIDGVPAPHAAPMTMDTKGEPIRDAVGNPLGGLRAAELDVPLARYGAYTGSDRPECQSSGGRPAIWRSELPATALKARYGSIAQYTRQFDAAVDRLVVGRWLLPTDAARLKAKAAREAATDFGS